MTSAQNHQQQLSGNKIFRLFVKLLAKNTNAFEETYTHPLFTHNLVHCF